MSQSHDLPGFKDIESIATFFEHLPQCKALGITCIDSKPGEARMRLDYAANQVGNPMAGYVHGGVITTLMDTVSSLVAMNCSPAIKMIATLDLRIDYLHPAKPGEPLIGHAFVERETRHVAFVRGEAHQGDEECPVARCSATIMITERHDAEPKGQPDA